MPTVSQRYAPPRAARTTAAGGRAAMRSVPAAPVVLMVSGGADSTALLLLACTSKLDILDGAGCARIARERLHVLHVNHHLRGAASDGDERFVRDLCERYGLPLCVEHASFAELSAGCNLEAAARDVRYAAARRYVRELCRMQQVPLSAARICTAHTASDRTETFFMNAIKGSGPAGLSSIPRRRNNIVRPLMDKTHEELCRYLEVSGQTWCEDETNADTSYLRNFVRHRLVPLARERNANLERAISAASDIVGDEDAFMAQLAAKSLRACTRRMQEGLVVLDAARLASAEVAIARRMIRLAFAPLAPEARLEMRHVEAVLRCIAAGSGSLTLPGGVDARLEFGALALRAPVARERLVAAWITVPGSMALANHAVLEAQLIEVRPGQDAVALARQARDEGEAAGASVACVDVAALGFSASCGAAAHAADTVRLWVDAPEAGDLMCPLGMQGRSKKVSDVLGAARIPVAERDTTPIVRTAPGGSVVWVGGIRLDERFKCTAATRQLVKLTIRSVLVPQAP